MQVINFNIPRFHDDLAFRFGGNSYDIPFAQFRNPQAIPFTPSDFEKTKNKFSLPEQLLTFFGIDDNSPLPPTLNGTGRGQNLLGPLDLAALDAELTPIYGYPNWLYIDLGEWIRYEMKKENERWFQDNGGSALKRLEGRLKEFAQTFAKNQVSVSKIQFLLKMPEEKVQKQLAENIFFFDTLADGAEYKKYFQPSAFLNRDNKNTDVLEVVLPKKYPIDYLKYIQITQIGDKDNIPIVGFNSLKLVNDANIFLYLTGSDTELNATKYPLFIPLPDLAVSNEKYNVSIFYTPKTEIFAPTYSNSTREPEAEPDSALEPEAEPDSALEQEASKEPYKRKKTAKDFSPLLPLLLVFFILLLIVLQKSSL